MRILTAAPLCALMLLGGCNSTDGMVDGVKSAGSAVADKVGGVTTSLVNVNLSNVLNDLALDLKIDRANIPVNAQIPINVAANVCGVSINILSIGGGGSSQGCTARNTSPELTQAVQQQLAANGNVGGGAQTNGSASTTTTAPTSPQPAATAPTPTSPPVTNNPATPTTQPPGN